MTSPKINIPPNMPALLNGRRKKILFANIPADGHFNPLTALAVHLRDQGHEVRWYTGPSYAPKIEKLGIPYYLFNKAKEVTVHNIDAVFPRRQQIRNHVKKVIFDICTYFIERGPEFYEDIRDINESYDFDVLVADNTFTGISFVKEKLRKHTVAIGILPLSESSPNLPPPIMGLTPATTPAGRAFHAALRLLVNKVLLKKPHQLMHACHRRYGITLGDSNLFDAQIEKSTLYLQSGSPGFEYPRPAMSRHIHFIGPLLPHRDNSHYHIPFMDKLQRYKKVILVTQGTFEPDVNKLIVPTLEAFRDTDHLVIVTTAGWHTGSLRERYGSSDNVVIEDFIPFERIMPFAHVFVSTGGFGGVMLSVCNKLPIVAAGIHEGKNEICARIGYFRLGINLRTEKPSAGRVKKAVLQVLADRTYKRNTEKLAAEFASYDPLRLCTEHIEGLPVVAGK
ncbi:nucleotide disphospho-sugar-binding domain-containing protein [Chitinophaga sp.]|uniref:glycosyltransferase n=1 Tax=Chitinophaga sp. TaxID=1869181 RepID=UPI0031E1F880